MAVDAAMDPKFQRLIYTAEFLLALIAVFTLWSQVGGQAHLDQMPWYFKLFFGLAMSYSVTAATSAAVAGERGWNVRTLRWVLILAFLITLAGLVTYYYHVYEPVEEEESQPAVQTSLRPVAGRVR
jgi:glucan phosphoethanolaminetransferase (alkaline phosphatase superfamily)